MAHDVFISHSSKDKAIADAVCATLEGKGIRCWIAPRDVPPGKDWGEAIIEGLEGSRIMILVFSSHANESVNVPKEVERAINKGLDVVPFRVEDVKLSKKLEYHLSSVHWLDALTPPLQQHIAYLADKVARSLGQVSGTPTAHGAAGPSAARSQAPTATAPNDGINRRPSGDAKEIEVGDVFTGRVVANLEKAALVQLTKSTAGLLHLSRMAPRGQRVTSVEDYVKRGDIVTVEVVEIDPVRRLIGLSLLRGPSASP